MSEIRTKATLEIVERGQSQLAEGLESFDHLSRHR